VLDARGTGVKRRWLIKWLGWGYEHNTWEPREHLTGTGVVQMVREFDVARKGIHT
jgi:hypothetical protein